MTKPTTKAQKEAKRIMREANQKPPQKPVILSEARELKEQIDWTAIERRVRRLSRAGDDGVRLEASPEERLAEAHLLAEVYRQAGKPLPDTLAVMV